MSTTNTDRTTAAEARFVEEGHHCILDHDEIGPHVRVVSDTLGQRGVAYKVRAATAGPGQPLVFDCAADGRVGRDGHPPKSSTNGVPPCKHAAGAARRLGREGYATPVLPGVHGSIAYRDTRWVATDAINTPGVVIHRPAETRPGRDAAMAAAAAGVNDDPFAGF